MVQRGKGEEDSGFWMLVFGLRRKDDPLSADLGRVGIAASLTLFSPDNDIWAMGVSVSGCE